MGSCELRVLFLSLGEIPGKGLSTDLKVVGVLGTRGEANGLERSVSPEGRTPEGRLLLARITPAGHGRVSLPS